MALVTLAGAGITRPPAPLGGLCGRGPSAHPISALSPLAVTPIVPWPKTRPGGPASPFCPWFLCSFQPRSIPPASALSWVLLDVGGPGPRRAGTWQQISKSHLAVLVPELGAPQGLTRARKARPQRPTVRPGTHGVLRKWTGAEEQERAGVPTWPSGWMCQCHLGPKPLSFPPQSAARFQLSFQLLGTLCLAGRDSDSPGG